MALYNAQLANWLVKGLIIGYQQGRRTFTEVTTLTESYLSNGRILEEQALEIMNACPIPTAEIEESNMLVEEEVDTSNIEEPIIESIESVEENLPDESIESIIDE